jgi:hypothetical protein
MGQNIFEYKEMLAIISRVRRKEREISLLYRRFIFPMLSNVFEYHGCERRYNRLLRKTYDNIILFQTKYSHFEGKNVNLRRVYNVINTSFRFIHDLMSTAQRLQ